MILHNNVQLQSYAFEWMDGSTEKVTKKGGCPT